MKQYRFTTSAYGHAEGDIVALCGWDEFYLTRKHVIEQYHPEIEVVERESEIFIETPEAHKRPKKSRKK